MAASFETIYSKLDNLKKHVSIIGRTDTGKTTFAKKLHEHTDKTSIFFNTQDEDVVGHRTKKWDKNLLAEHRKINFIPDENEEIGSIQLNEIYYDLRHITEDLNDRSRKTRFIVFVDESHEYAPNGAKGTPLHKIFKRGHRYGIRGISMTQRPAELDKGIVTQANFHVIFDVDDFESSYFKTKNIPIHLVQDQLVNSHNFTIYVNKHFLGVFTLDL